MFAAVRTTIWEVSSVVQLVGGGQTDALELHRAQVGGHADTVAVAHLDDGQGTVAAARVLVFLEEGVREEIGQSAAGGDDAA